MPYQYDREAMEVLEILCAYLPAYAYNDAPSAQYMIEGCSATSAHGLHQAVDSFVKLVKR